VADAGAQGRRHRRAGGLGAWLMTTTRRAAWRSAQAERRYTPVDDEVLAGAPGPPRGRTGSWSPRRRRPCCGTASSGWTPAASACCASSPSTTGPTTPRSPPTSGCRSAASDPPADAAWPSCAACSRRRRESGHERRGAVDRPGRHVGGARPVPADLAERVLVAIAMDDLDASTRSCTWWSAPPSWPAPAAVRRRR
jgi:hypothetical protein